MCGYRLIATGALVFAAGMWGCAYPGTGRASLTSRDADQRIKAIVRTAETRDNKAVPLLVDRLEDHDEAVRMFAIEALRRLTGQSMGWRYYEPPLRRAAAVAAWRAWLADRRPGGESRPASAPAGES